MLSSYPLPSIIVIPYEVQKKILLEYWYKKLIKKQFSNPVVTHETL
jgi:hypothetical protein